MLSVLLAALVVVCLSALCSLSEAAFLSLPLVRARALAKVGGRAARTVLRIKENVQAAISAIVILNTIVNMAGASFVATRAAAVAEEAAAAGDIVVVSGAWFTALLTIAVVLFGEILPKTLGERFNVGVTMAAALPVLCLITLFHPFGWLTERFVDRIAPRRRRHVTSKEEISAMAEMAEREGAIRSSEAAVIQRVFRLNDITAEDTMTPRIRARMLAADATLEEARAELTSIQYSRIPLYSGTRDHVTGILRRTDALLALVEGRAGSTLEQLGTKAKFVPATMSVDRLLLELQRERVQIAIVVGEYGETIGLVTVEDIVEELVGEILDEKDVDERTIKRLSREEILVHGQTEIDRINRFFNVELPDERPTIAGLLLDTLGRLPRAGEHVLVGGVDIVVDEVNERAIVRVRLLKPSSREAVEKGSGPA
ncbi:MAG: HlyC/CorC family transporter [Planctomycetaceae bacterium]|nr:hemolysin family protein [Planctomycetota bacterium]NUN52931.1 HlyC/CorC family transporter [Planctomycetaceae bacterium]